MPNKTFDNLSTEKKEAVINAALNEFNTHDYDSASLNQIINDIGIAKGSFYRYFNNKKELYSYLIDYCVDNKFKYVNPAINTENDDCFEYLRNIIYSHFNFSEKCEAQGKFLRRAFLNNDLSRDKFLFLNTSKQELIDIIIKYQKSGVLNPDYNVEFIFYCISQIIMGPVGFVKELSGTDKGNDTDKLSVGFEEKKLVFDQIINFFKYGLSNNKENRL